MWLFTVVFGAKSVNEWWQTTTHGVNNPRPTPSLGNPAESTWQQQSVTGWTTLKPRPLKKAGCLNPRRLGTWHTGTDGDQVEPRPPSDHLCAYKKHKTWHTFFIRFSLELQKMVLEKRKSPVHVEFLWIRYGLDMDVLWVCYGSLYGFDTWLEGQLWFHYGWELDAAGSRVWSGKGQGSLLVSPPLIPCVVKFAVWPRTKLCIRHEIAGGLLTTLQEAP